MIAVVAHPATALRVLRRAGRRRALRVVLFVGGLLALGFLWGGGQAYAAEAPPLPLPHDSGPAAAAAVVPEEVPGLREWRVVREAVEPAADVVRRVTRPVGELKDRVAERRSAAPVPVPVPELPTSEVTVAAVRVASVPSVGGGLEVPTEAAKSVHQGSGGRAQPAKSGSVSDTVGVADFGAYPYDVSEPRRDAGQRSPGRAECGEAPVPAPAGPCGDGVRQSAGDGSSSRSGDQHAAAFANGARFGPVRGATLPATTAPTYDRPHEILEFPG